VINLSCASQENDTNFPIGPDAGTTTNSVIAYPADIAVNDVNVTLNLEHTWIGDLTITLIAPDNTQVVLADGICGDCDDMIDVTFDDEAADPIGTATDPVTGTYQPEGNLSDFDGLSTLGDWTLRIVDNANQDGGQLLDWTLQLCGDPILGVDDTTISNSELVVTSLPDNQFEISLLSDYDGLVYVGVYNLIGQQIGFKLVPRVNDKFRLNLNMSNAASGVYLLRVGGQSSQTYKSARIIVQ
jgi:subtilisin-like proprotein convertase family protein